jgi:UDP-N-acetylmuramoylalanine-D-glutamate ligase
MNRIILGGNSKKLSMHDLTASIEKYKRNICRIILLKGSMTDEIAPELMKMSDITCTEIFNDFTLAVRRSMEEASKIDEPVYLLFSPGATSFAQFRNEFDRGEKFNAIVSDIMSK